jgi:hypothetical protein
MDSESILEKLYLRKYRETKKMGYVWFFADKLIVKNENTTGYEYTEQEVWRRFLRLLQTIKGGLQLFNYIDDPTSHLTFTAYFDLAYGGLKNNGVYRGFRIVPKCEWESHIGYISEYSDSESEADDPMAS